MNLSCNFRNTREIFEFAWEFVKDDFVKGNFDMELSGPVVKLYNNIEVKRRGPKPILRKFTSEEEERDAICLEIKRIVTEERVSPHGICILYPNATEKNADSIKPYLAQIENIGIQTYWLSKDNRNKINYDPRDSHITLSTPESGKGLEWDIVFMPSIERYQNDNSNNLRFVAAMRARHILYPSTCGDY